MGDRKRTEFLPTAHHGSRKASVAVQALRSLRKSRLWAGGGTPLRWAQMVLRSVAMNSDRRTEYLARQAVLAFLSDDEIAA